MSEPAYDITEGVDKDGTIEDSYQGIETYYCPLETIIEREHYLRIVGDNGGDNVEIRLPKDVLVLNGWTPPAEPFAERAARQPRLPDDGMVFIPIGEATEECEAEDEEP